MSVKKILFLGASPPPENGIACHMRRLAHLTHTEGFKVLWYDPYSYRVISYKDNQLNIIQLSKIVFLIKLILHLNIPQTHLHLHASRLGKLMWGWPLIQFCLIPKKRRYLSIHGAFRESYTRYSKTQKRMAKRLISAFSKVVVTNNSIKEFLDAFHFSNVSVTVIPAYLPLIEDTRRNTVTMYDSLMAEDCPKVVVCGSAEKIYGFEFAIGIFEEHLILDPNVKYIFCIYHRKNSEIFKKISDFSADNENVVIFQDLNEYQFYHILKQGDLFLRPTEQDGDSIAVREAIALNKPVVATNCCPRPKGCIVPGDRDTKNWAKTVHGQLNENVPSSPSENENFESQFLALYGNR